MGPCASYPAWELRGGLPEQGQWSSLWKMAWSPSAGPGPLSGPTPRSLQRLKSTPESFLGCMSSTFSSVICLNAAELCAAPAEPARRAGGRPCAGRWREGGRPPVRGERGGDAPAGTLRPLHLGHRCLCQPLSAGAARLRGCLISSGEAVQGERSGRFRLEASRRTRAN